MSDTDVKEIAPTGGIRFVVASRPQRRFSANQTVSNLNTSTSFQPIQLPATGFVRKISLFFTATYTTSASAAIVAGDAPFNLIAGVTLTDATGQPVMQPVSGYNLSRINKYFGSGIEADQRPLFLQDPQVGPEFAYSVPSGTSGAATFRLDIDLEQDSGNGYGSVPNLDSNASLQLKIDVAPHTVAFSGGTASAASVSVRVSQWYWAPVGATLNNIPASTQPPGFGDYLETRYETQTVTASAENTVNVTNRGGMIKGIIAVSRAAGTRTAFTAGSNVGLILDNNPVDEGITLEEQKDFLRRNYGYIGADVNAYTPLATAGALPGLDTGVLVWNFDAFGESRDEWLSTRVGSLLQLKVTPGAAATQIELITQLMQVKDSATFFNE